MLNRYLIFILFMAQFALPIASDVATGPYSVDKLIEQLKMSNAQEPLQNTAEQNKNFHTPLSDTNHYDFIAKSVFEFGQDIGFNLLEMRPENKYEVYSPLSIVAALNLLLLGAKGDTFNELFNVLKYSSNPVLLHQSSKIHEEFSQVLKELTSNSATSSTKQQLPWKENFFSPLSSEMYRNNYGERQKGNGNISIANGLFIQKGYSIRDSYINVAKNLYDCEINNLDFFSNPSGAAKYINNWINQQTKGLVPKIVGDSVAPETKAIITNSLYFKAEWHNEFLDGATGWKNFYPNGLTQDPIIVEMMANAGRFPYFASEEMNCQIMGFPYKLNQSTMYIILPNNSNKQNVIKLQTELTFDRLENMINRMEVKTAVILLPKMSLTSQSNLRDILMRLGLRSVFSPRLSDLSLIASNNNEGITSGRVMNGITSGKVERLTMSQTQSSDVPMRNMDSLHNQLIFSRIEDDIESPTKREKREVTYKVESSQAPSPLNFKDFIINKRISKSNPDKRKSNRRQRRNISESNLFLQELERLRYENLQNPGLFANDVLHKVNLIVNEQGTEAAAATAVTINRSGPQVTFRVETPFLILIRHDDTKLPLFYGSIYQPVN